MNKQTHEKKNKTKHTHIKLNPRVNPLCRNVPANCMYMASNRKITPLSDTSTLMWSRNIHFVALIYSYLDSDFTGALSLKSGVNHYTLIVSTGGQRFNKRKPSQSTHTAVVRKASKETVCAQRQTGATIVCWLVGCLTSQQQASVSQGRICSDNFTCCHTEIEVADPTFYLTQSQYTDTGPTSPSADPITPGAWQGSHWSANF